MKRETKPSSFSEINIDKITMEDFEKLLDDDWENLNIQNDHNIGILHIDTITLNKEIFQEPTSINTGLMVLEIPNTKPQDVSILHLDTGISKSYQSIRILNKVTSTSDKKDGSWASNPLGPH